jgi:hypothetical protein
MLSTAASPPRACTCGGDAATAPRSPGLLSNRPPSVGGLAPTAAVQQTSGGQAARHRGCQEWQLRRTTWRTWAMAKGTGSCEWSPNSTGVEWSPVTTMLQQRQAQTVGVAPSSANRSAGRGCCKQAARGNAWRRAAGTAQRPRPPVAPVAAPLLAPQQAQQLPHHPVHDFLVPRLQAAQATQAVPS